MVQYILPECGPHLNDLINVIKNKLPSMVLQVREFTI